MVSSALFVNTKSGTYLQQRLLRLVYSLSYYFFVKWYIWKILKDWKLQKIHFDWFRTSYLKIINNKNSHDVRVRISLLKCIKQQLQIYLYNLPSVVHFTFMPICGTNVLLLWWGQGFELQCFIMCSLLSLLVLEIFLLGCAILLYYLSVNSCLICPNAGLSSSFTFFFTSFTISSLSLVKLLF
jgi:hypothetical protein